jgi:hypothetical protein
MNVNEAVRRIAAEDRHFLRHLSLQSLPSLTHFLERDPYRPQLGIKNLLPSSAEETQTGQRSEWTRASLHISPTNAITPQLW